MFSTFLKEIKDVFNKWALFSAFYPSLIFWTLAVVFVVARKEGWSKAQGRVIEWDKKALIILGCLVWVSFWSSLTINLQPALVRIFEGYWHFKTLANVRRRVWQKRWDKMKEKDEALAKEQTILYSERKDFGGLRKGAKPQTADRVVHGHEVDLFLNDLQTNLNRIGGFYGGSNYVRQAGKYWDIIQSNLAAPADGDANWPDRGIRLMQSLGHLLGRLERQSDTFVRRARRLLLNFQRESPGAFRLQRLGKQTRAYWLNLQVCLESPLSETAWLAGRSKNLAEIMDKLLKMVQQQLDEVEERRLDHDREFLLYYPPGRDDVMPTKLGNVLKGADKRVYNRYRLDPAIMWSRLQPQLGKEFAESLQNVKGPFDLMITLSSFSILFGFLLSSYEAVHLKKPWLILIFVLVIPLFSSRIVSRIALPVVASVVIWIFSAPLHINLTTPDSVSQFGTLSVLMLGTGLLAALTYTNAVQACMVYCEKIQTAFDLYRWKVLEEMHLQLPPNFEEERDIWKDLSGLLYRSEKPRPSYYRYVPLDKKTKDPVRPLSLIIVPKKTLPPYYCITENDITEIEIPEAQVPVDAIRSKQDFLGKASLKMLAGGTPVPRSHLVEPQTLDNTVAIGIQTDFAHAVGGNLAVGNRVDLIIVPSASAAQAKIGLPPPGANSVVTAAAASQPIIIEDTLVLDIKNPSDSTKILLAIAIPLSRKSDYLNNLDGGFHLTRRPGAESVSSSQHPAG